MKEKTTKYIIKITNQKTKKSYYLGLDDMDFYPVTNKKIACRFDNTEEVELELDLWLNEQEKAEVIEVKC